MNPTLWEIPFHSSLFLQDFFDKLNDCLWSRKILPVFKLLAHALNSQVLRYVGTDNV